jgi:XisI protein
MEKIIKYQTIIADLVKQIGAWVIEDNIETQVIIDHENGHYLLFSVGWYENTKREYAPFLHIDLKPNGKVYLQHDGTDLKIALLLTEKGIDKSDIILAFHASQRRQLVEGFATI